LPDDFEQVEPPPESPEGLTATVDVRDSGAGRELTYHVRHEDMPAACPAADAGGDVDGGTEEDLLVRDRLPRVQSDAHAERDGGVRSTVARTRLLDGDRAPDRSRRRAEGGHQTVSGVADLGAAVGRERGPDDGVVRAQHGAGSGVAEPVDRRRRALD